jgi:hypothetical protein
MFSGIEGMDSENSLITQARREPSIPAKEKAEPAKKPVAVTTPQIRKNEEVIP